MGERTSYAPGTISWADLATTDPEGAKAFYCALFGWEAEDMPAGPGATYTMLRLGGRSAAALYEMREDQRRGGMPPAWLVYVTVDDLEGTAHRAAELGGTVLAEPFDVLDAGRMAVVQDPLGGTFALWEPGRSIGAEIVNVPGAMAWNDLSTPDVDGAREFYGDLFGWDVDETGMGEVDYRGIRNAGAKNGGIMRSQAPPGVPPFWNVYFAVEDMDDAIARATGLGGEVVMPPLTVPAGQFAVLRDPQGAVFSLVSGEMDP